ncbi:hypothetical protein [Primorskyibacter sp. S87]|uniref:hypothetical protein n=1 Tax=Primorskyibacter sp. S87 TaxID=3415126 RepID=UPI003C7CFA76
MPRSRAACDETRAAVGTGQSVTRPATFLATPLREHPARCDEVVGGPPLRGKLIDRPLKLLAVEPDLPSDFSGLAIRQIPAHPFQFEL